MRELQNVVRVTKALLSIAVGNGNEPNGKSAHVVLSMFSVGGPFFAGTVLSAGRLGMMGFPLFWSLAILGRREGVDTAVKILFPPLMAALMFVAYAYQTFTP